MRTHNFGDLLTGRIDGIERGHRFLKNHRRLPAADVAQCFVAERQHVASIEENFAAWFDAARGLDQPQNGERCERLSASAFADQRQRLAARDLERHAIHRSDHAIGGAKRDADVAQREQGIGGRCVHVGHVRGSCRGASASRNPSPSALTARTTVTRHKPGPSETHGALARNS